MRNLASLDNKGFDPCEFDPWHEFIEFNKG